MQLFSLVYLTKIISCFAYQILWAKKKERITLSQNIIRGVLFFVTGVSLSFKFKAYGFIIAYFAQGIYDSIFYYVVLKDFRSTMSKSIVFIICLFFPVFFVMNIVGYISNFYSGVLAVVVIYLLLAKYLFIPFVEIQFNIKLESFLLSFTKRVFGSSNE